ncbi:MAG: hypothetical protein K2N80_00405, partial [Lachnospiraceae bacterium]|nr:hypothetical protein [Lachnospiraceae bacterium]
KKPEKTSKTKNRIESFRFRCLCWWGRVKVTNENAAKEILKETFGNVILDDFKGLVSRKYNDRIAWHKGDSDLGANNITLAKIVIEKDIVDSRGMKDSDAKEDKENDA